MLCIARRSVTLPSVSWQQDVESMLHKLLVAADSNVHQAQRGIIYIDEVDKITRSDNATMTRDVSGAPPASCLFVGVCINIKRVDAHARRQHSGVPVSVLHCHNLARMVINGRARRVVGGGSMSGCWKTGHQDSGWRSGTLARASPASNIHHLVSQGRACSRRC